IWNPGLSWSAMVTVSWLGLQQNETRRGKQLPQRAHGWCGHYAAPSSGINWPRPSSATRSSEAPTCVWPMKICGTVRRPVSAIICWRAAGSASMRSSSICSTPLAFRSCLARTQEGQTAVVYIFTACMALFRGSGFFHRQAGCPPGSEAAGHGLGVVIAELPGHGHRTPGAGAGGAHQNHGQRLVLDDGGQALFDLAQGQVPGANHMAGGKLLGLADIDDHGFFAVDHLHDLGGRQRAVPGVLDERPQQHAARSQCNEEQIPVVNDEFHEGTLGLGWPMA